MKRFAARKPRLLAVLGDKYADVVNSFEEMVRSKYAPYILLRTAGLPAPESQEEGLRAALAEMEAFGRGSEPSGSVALSLNDVLSESGKTAVYLLAGDGAGEQWPPSEIADRFGLRKKEQGRVLPKPVVPASEYRSNSVAAWSAAIVLGLATVGVYLRTHSVVLSVLTFVGVTVIVVFVLLRGMKKSVS